MLKHLIHLKCRNNVYPFSDIHRFFLNDDQVPWNINLENYNPPEYNSPVILNKIWADPVLDDLNFTPKWNQLDGDINRKSHTGIYVVGKNGPLNPSGRTGLTGRGVLGKWGPNHAADPIVTRWKFVDGKRTIGSTNLPVLQFCGIQRHDCGQWAIPGGMVDPGEKVSETLKREFLEEAFNILQDKNSNIEIIINDFFQNGEEVYKGYVDDPRNTDNAWMETIAVNFHDETNEIVGQFKLKAGDDARNAEWIDIDKNLDLYANHSNFIETVAKLRKAHW